MNALRSALVAARPLLWLFSSTLTIGAYLIGRAVQRRTGSALLNPVLSAIVIVGVVLRSLNVSYADYLDGAKLLNYLLGLAVIALAIPLVRAIEQIGHNLWPMIFALLAGSLTGMLSGYGFVRAAGGSQLLALSMLPKCSTTPIAIEAAAAIGGLPSVSAVLAILSGILVAVSVNYWAQLVGVRDPGAVGLAAGTAGSGIGASRVIPQDPLSAAFAAAGIALNGLLTAALAPIIVRLIQHTW